MASVGNLEPDRPRLDDLRSQLTCVICAGYFIDATTIVECLHTFCRSCILRHLETSSYCPVCDVMIHRTKGSSSLRADRILQTLVYKLVPGLFEDEMLRRREFYERKPYADPELPGWAKGDVDSFVPHVYTADEDVHVRLTLFTADRAPDGAASPNPTAEAVPPARYLRCAARTPLTALQKFVRTKFQLSPAVQVQLVHGRHVLPDGITLMDLAYMHGLAKGNPVQLLYRLVRNRKRHVAQSERGPSLVGAPETKVARLDDCPYSDNDVISTTTAAACGDPMDDVTDGPPSADVADGSPAADVTGGPSTADVTDGPPTADVTNGSPTTDATNGLPTTDVTDGPPTADVTDGSPTADVTDGPPTRAAGGHGCVTPEPMFDADDEEPTSPQVVEDIIASLDAEEEPGGLGQSLAGVAARGEGAECEGQSQSQRRTVAVSGRAEVLPERAADLTGDANSWADVTREVKDMASPAPCAASEVIGAESGGAAGRVEASDEEQGVHGTDDVKIRVKDVSGGPCSVQSNLLLKPLQSIGTSERGGQDSVGDAERAHERPLGFSGERNGSRSEVREKITGTSVTSQPKSAAGEVLTDARPHLSHLQTHGVSSEDTRNSALTLSVPRPSKVDCSVQTLRLTEAAKPTTPHGRKRPCYAPKLAGTEKCDTTVRVSQPAPTARSPDTGTTTGQMNGGTLSARDVRESRHSEPYMSTKLATVTETLAADRRTTPNIPKSVESTLLGNPTTCRRNLSSRILDPVKRCRSYLKTVAAENNARKLNSNAISACKDAHHATSASDHPQQECVALLKPVQVQQDRQNSAVPLDLSSHPRKTAVADSTSMLAGTPPPAPKPKHLNPKSKKGQDTRTLHSIVHSLANREHISLTAIPTKRKEDSKKRIRTFKKPACHRSPVPEVSKRLSPHNRRSPTAAPTPMSVVLPESTSCCVTPGSMFSSPLHVNTSMASRLSYDMAMRNLLTLSHMAMAQGGMVRPPMFPMQAMFPPRPKSQDFHPIPDPSLLRQQSEARMGAASKKASPTAGSTAPQLRTPTALTSASIQHMEDLTRTLGKRPEKQRHSVTVTAIPSSE